ncbi:MAG TPA: ABC transporter permease [Bacteroidales bacterium]|nr:ABC transporter permease [Bacteroidales bacterium]HPI69193.1 ABC transporter permease [Bacteroidales bacterium]HPR73913.1 ABC transporter permease [Bacteroidales bacterium]
MLRNYINSSWRNLLKNKSYFFMNTGGLVLGTVVAILTGLWINDEINFNKYHNNYESIARVVRFEGGGYTSYICPTGLGTLLKTNYGDHFKNVVMVRGMVEERSLATDNKSFLEKGYFMQPEGPEMFGLKMKYGTQSGLNDIHSILLSESTALKIFGDRNPLSEIVRMDDRWDLEVAGVYEDLPLNSEFNEASYLAPLNLFLGGPSALNVWNNYNMYIYVQINPGGDFGEISSIIKEIAVGPTDNPEHEVLLHPWSDWKSEYKNRMKIVSQRYELVRLIGIIGILVFLLACVNFMNLSTAQSEKLSGEIGIRKSLGSNRSQLIIQFLTQSMIISAIAFALSIILVIVLLPELNAISGKNISFMWDNIRFWISGIVFIIVAGFLSGGYPAFYLSSFRPVEALQNKRSPGSQKILLRKGLIIFQFAVSICLLIATITVYKQVQYAKDRPAGYNSSGLLTLTCRSPELTVRYETLKDELKSTGMVLNTAQSNYPITSDKGWNGYFNWEGKISRDNPTFNIMNVTADYCETVGLEFIAGRDFSKDITSDRKAIIINESALEIMGLKDPVGKIITWHPPFIEEPVSFSVLGVVKDMIKGSPYEPAFPSILIYSDPGLSELFIRIDPNVSIDRALPEIEKVFKNVVPTIPFDYKFADSEYNKKFAAENQTGIFSGILALIAVLLSCMGLYGLASFTIEKRTKEIGIRKINGATITGILALLNKNYFVYVVVAFIIGCPVVFIVMQRWLQNFTYRTELSWIIFALAGLLALGIALLTVSWQSWRAATRNPVEALRYE